MTPGKKPSSKVPAEAAASEAEIRDAIGNLSEAQLLRIRRFTQLRLGKLGRRAEGQTIEDVMHEAIRRTLEGPRHWYRAKVPDFDHYLVGVIKSITSQRRGQRFSSDYEYPEAELIVQSPEGGEKNPLADTPTDDPNPEEISAAKEALDRVLAMFEGEEHNLHLLIIDGWREGLTGPEIQEILGITQKEFETAARYIRRNAKNLFPERG